MLTGHRSTPGELTKECVGKGTRLNNVKRRVGQWYLEGYNKNIWYCSTELEKTKLAQIVGSPSIHPFIHPHANIRDHIFDLAS